MAVIYVVIWYVLKYTTYGRQVFAVGGNPKVAQLAGIDTAKIRFISHILAAVTAALGGIITVSQTAAAMAKHGAGNDMDGIAAVILGGSGVGGKGQVTGTLFGILLLSVLVNGMTLLNVQAMTVPIDEIGQIIGEELGLDFNADLPSDFWDSFYPQNVPYIPADGDYYLSEDTYSSIVDYLCSKGAFTDYRQYGDIPYMVLPAGRYPSADGQNAIEARADIYIIAAMEKKNGRPESLPNPSCVDYPYTNLYVYNQIQVLTFTLNSSDYIRCAPGLKGGYNSATSGICRKMAGLGLYDVDDDTMYTNYATFPDDNIVSIPGILALPWCWYDNLPKDLSVLKNIVQHGSKASGCTGITHDGKVPYLTYSKGSLYEEVKEQCPELFTSNVTYGDTTYVHGNA
jgi:hypothetical protein